MRIPCTKYLWNNYRPVKHCSSPQPMQLPADGRHAANTGIAQASLARHFPQRRECVLDILPSHLDLASAELELVTIFERERRLRQALAPIQHQYDYIIIDCPPSLGLLTLNALMAATEVLIPVDPGMFPLIGLNLLNRTIEMVRQSNPALKILGVVPTLQDRTALARDTMGQLGQAFGDKLMPAIPRRVAIGEAHAAGQDIFTYDANGDSAEAFAALLQEVVGRG